jgi:hypothetical protein
LLSKGNTLSFHAQGNSKIFFNIFLLQLMLLFTYFESKFKRMAKKKSKGRPKGSEKEPLNIYIHKERAAKLRGFARDEQKTISIVVENALEAQYGI